MCSSIFLHTSLQEVYKSTHMEILLPYLYVSSYKSHEYKHTDGVSVKGM